MQSRLNLCFSFCKQNLKLISCNRNKEGKTETKGDEVVNNFSEESEIYAEIGDPESSFTYTQNILYGASPCVQYLVPLEEHDNDNDTMSSITLDS